MEDYCKILQNFIDNDEEKVVIFVDNSKDSERIKKFIEKNEDKIAEITNFVVVEKEGCGHIIPSNVNKFPTIRYIKNNKIIKEGYGLDGFSEVLSEIAKNE